MASVNASQFNGRLEPRGLLPCMPDFVMLGFKVSSEVAGIRAPEAGLAWPVICIH